VIFNEKVLDYLFEFNYNIFLTASRAASWAAATAAATE
jgi:hypothetical protein